MGACFSSNKTHPAGAVPTAAQKEHDKRIDDGLRAQQDEERKVIKCLLLGAGQATEAYSQCRHCAHPDYGCAQQRLGAGESRSFRCIH